MIAIIEILKQNYLEKQQPIFNNKTVYELVQSVYSKLITSNEDFMSALPSETLEEISILY